MATQTSERSRSARARAVGKPQVARASGSGETRRRSVQEVLQGCPWYVELPEAARHAFVQGAQERTFRTGDAIAAEGAPANGMHVLLSGTVRITRSVGLAQQMLMMVGAPGFIISLYSSIAGRAECVTFTCEAATRTLWLPQPALEALVTDPDAHRTFLRLLWDRYELLMIGYAASQHSASEDWLRIRLGTLARLQRVNGQADPSTIALPQAELADILGVSRQTLNSLLNRLAARGVIEVGYRRIRLLT